MYLGGSTYINTFPTLHVGSSIYIYATFIFVSNLKVSLHLPIYHFTWRYISTTFIYIFNSKIAYILLWPRYIGDINLSYTYIHYTLIYHSKLFIYPNLLPNMFLLSISTYTPILISHVLLRYITGVFPQLKSPFLSLTATQEPILQNNFDNFKTPKKLQTLNLRHFNHLHHQRIDLLWRKLVWEIYHTLPIMCPMSNWSTCTYCNKNIL